MFMKFVRENRIAAALLTVLRLYLGYSWFTAGFGKLQSSQFNASGFLAGAVAKPVASPDGVVYGWYVSFLKNFAIPNADVFNVVIPVGETLVGLGLLLGCFTTAAAFFGLVMNFSFLLAGTVSHNPTDILLGGIILAAGLNAGVLGLDRWVIPFIRKTVFKQNTSMKNSKNVTVKSAV